MLRYSSGRLSTRLECPREVYLLGLLIELGRFPLPNLLCLHQEWMHDLFACLYSLHLLRSECGRLACRERFRGGCHRRQRQQRQPQYYCETSARHILV